MTQRSTGIADGSKTVVATYQYDAFGAVRAQTGGSANEFKFTGEQVDGSGLQYLRARYYDPATGRFLGRDPVPYLQRYAYAFNNPVNLVDPSGMDPLSDAFGAAAECIHAAVWDGNLDPCKPILEFIEACLEGAMRGTAVGIGGAIAGCAVGVGNKAASDSQSRGDGGRSEPIEIPSSPGIIEDEGPACLPQIKVNPPVAVPNATTYTFEGEVICVDGGMGTAYYKLSRLVGPNMVPWGSPFPQQPIGPGQTPMPGSLTFGPADVGSVYVLTLVAVCPTCPHQERRASAQFTVVWQ